MIQRRMSVSSFTQFFGNVVRRFAPNFLTSKKAPFYWPTWDGQTVKWNLINYQNYAHEGFMLNTLIYAAIMYKVRAATQIKLQGYYEQGYDYELVSPRHPLARLLQKPNEHQTWTEMRGQHTVYLNLSGNSFFYLDRKGSRGANFPTAMYCLRPDRVYLIPATNGIKGYLYVPEGASGRSGGIPLLKEDVIHIKFPNPVDPFEGWGYGLSPMSALSQAGTVDNLITKFFYLFFKSGAAPRGVLKYDLDLDPEQVAQIKQRWREIYGGVENWVDVAVLDSGGTYQQVGQDLDKMTFEKIDDRNESRMLSVFGVPPILIGSRFGLAHATYTNYKEQRRAFWEDTMMYELALEEGEYSNYLRAPDNAIPKYDLSEVPALKNDVIASVDSAYKLWQMSVPAHTALQTVGLKIDEWESGLQSFLPVNMVEYVKSVSNMPKPPATPAAANTIDGEIEDVEETPAALPASTAAVNPALEEIKELRTRLKKSIHNNKIDSIAQSHETTFFDEAVNQFEEDRRQLAIILGEYKKRKAVGPSGMKAAIEWDDLTNDMLGYLQKESVDAWQKGYAPAFTGVANDAASYWAGELGVSFKIRNLESEAWFADYKLEFAQTVSDTTSDNIQDLLATAQSEGWSIQRSQNNMMKMFDQWQTGNVSPEDLAWMKARNTPWRAELIARTETIRMANAGSFNRYKEWGVESKEWSASGDKRTRHSHKEANGQVKKINDPFEVGRFMLMYPGDSGMGAPASETLACRCAVLPGEIAAAERQVEESYRRISSEEASGAYQDEWHNQIQKLTEDQKLSFYMYTDEYYKSINTGLRKKRKLKPDLQTIVKDMDAGFEHLRTPSEVLAYRGTRGDEALGVLGLGREAKLEDVQRLIGTRIVDRAYLSTTVDRSIAESWTGSVSDSNTSMNVLWEIEVPGGAKAGYMREIAKQKKEAELLLARDTKFEITGVTANEAGIVTQVRLKVVTDD